ncbi:hypothetical protein QCA50_008268 [Cerrena zonata]|uniref:Uncharacterized protein n=1 Tax=Cerrena zonata TaxID=2478898 RepID=A0AAW0GBN4_9APHY
MALFHLQLVGSFTHTKLYLASTSDKISALRKYDAKVDFYFYHTSRLYHHSYWPSIDEDERICAFSSVLPCTLIIVAKQTKLRSLDLVSPGLVLPSFSSLGRACILRT